MSASGTQQAPAQEPPVAWWYEDHTGCLHISLDLELGNKHASEDGWEINWLTSCEPSRFFETLVIGKPTPAQIETIRHAFYFNEGDECDDPWVRAFEAVQLRLGLPAPDEGDFMEPSRVCWENALAVIDELRGTVTPFLWEAHRPGLVDVTDRAASLIRNLTTSFLNACAENDRLRAMVKTQGENCDQSSENPTVVAVPSTGAIRKKAFL